MNQIQLTDNILKACQLHPLVNATAEGNIYEILNTKTPRYPICVTFANSSTRNDNSVTYNYTLFYCDRVLADHSNENAVQTTAQIVLQEVLNALNNASETINVGGGYTINLFSQRFADECAGGYVEIDIEVENTTGNCGVDTDFDPDVLSNYYTKAETNALIASAVKDGKLTIKQNGNVVGEFTANNEGDVTVEITSISPTDFYTKDEVDTKIEGVESQIPTDFYTQSQVDNLIEGVESQIPTIPTNVSAFTNDAGYLTEHQSLSEYYTKDEVDEKIAGTTPEVPPAIADKDVVMVSNYDEMIAQTAPSTEVLYMCLDTNYLYTYDGSNYNRVTTDSNVIVTSDLTELPELATSVGSYDVVHIKSVATSSHIEMMSPLGVYYGGFYDFKYAGVEQHDDGYIYKWARYSIAGGSLNITAWWYTNTLDLSVITRNVNGNTWISDAVKQRGRNGAILQNLGLSMQVVDISQSEGTKNVKVGYNLIVSEEGDAKSWRLTNFAGYGEWDGREFVWTYYSYKSDIDALSSVIATKADKTQVVTVTPSATNLIEPNRLYNFGTLSANLSVVLSDGDFTVTDYKEWMVEFNSGSGSNTISFPMVMPDGTSIEWQNIPSEITANKKYQLSIVDGCGLICEFNGTGE